MREFNKESSFLCQVCGKIKISNLNLYDKNLRVQNFNILPIYLTCRICGSDVLFDAHIKQDKEEIKVIILNGTCASGKTTIAEVLMRYYGFYVIDGDCVIKVVKHKLRMDKVEYNQKEVLIELARQIDILLVLKKNIVITQIMLQEDIHKYREILKERKLKYKIFLLQPNYETALLRSKNRTCFNGITPEKWIKYFYDELKTFNEKNNDDLTILDNSNQSVEESTKFILRSFNF